MKIVKSKKAISCSLERIGYGETFRINGETVYLKLRNDYFDVSNIVGNKVVRQGVNDTFLIAELSSGSCFYENASKTVYPIDSSIHISE